MRTSIKPFLTTLFICVIAACVSGCMLPKYTRLIPENKSARIRIVNPLYGYIEIDTRVVGDPNSLAPLPEPSGILGPVEPVRPSAPFVPANVR